MPFFFDLKYSLVDINNWLISSMKKLYIYSKQFLKGDQAGDTNPLLMLPMYCLGILKHPIFNMHGLVSTPLPST